MIVAQIWRKYDDPQEPPVFIGTCLSRHDAERWIGFHVQRRLEYDIAAKVEDYIIEEEETLAPGA